MKNLYLPTATLLLALSLPLSAQDKQRDTIVGRRPWQTFFDQLCDYDDIEDNNIEDMYERLCELEAAPINLNNATADDIRQLSFLSNEQMEDLTEYIDRYRPLHSIGELSMVASLDPMRIQLMQHFVYIGNENTSKGFPKFSNIAKYGKHELVATAGIPFYNRKGDRNGYLGYKYKHWARYSFRYGKYVQIGLTGTQDAGEPFFSGGNSLGYDHYAVYAVVRQLGALKTLALGQYKLRFGLGLAMNTGFSLGKTATLTMSPSANAISANASRSDAYYLQGAAATVAANRNIDVTGFVSYRKIDATLNDDGTIKTLLKTGYHRTPSEMQRKHNASQTTAGANIRWHSGGWHIGMSGIFATFSRSLNPDMSQLFRMYTPKGKDFYNASIDYGFISHRISINGETAMNGEGALATINTVSLKASSSLRLTAIQRYYSYRYHSLFSSSFSDGGKIQNESGIYLGAAWTPLPRLSILAYSDYAYFPWARYRVTASSHSLDNLIQATYSLSPYTTVSGRYRIRFRQEDYNNDDTDSKLLINKTEHRARATLAYNGSHWAAKTQADAAYTVFPAGLDDKPNSFGWMLTQTVAYNATKMSIAANLGYFHTHDYNSRLYAYERGTLYSFSFPMFYGEGMRGALFLRGNISKNLTAICKVGTTKYFDRSKISSSYQQIDSSWQTDMDLQIKWKF